MSALRCRWTTARLLSIAVVAAIGASASGEVIKVVSRLSARNVEGDRSASPPPDGIGVREQYLYLASDFAQLGIAPIPCWLQLPGGCHAESAS
jgi:hypothetical protein